MELIQAVIICFSRKKISPTNKRWVKYNDSQVTLCTKENLHSNHALQQSSPRILIYLDRSFDLLDQDAIFVVDIDVEETVAKKNADHEKEASFFPTERFDDNEEYEVDYDTIMGLFEEDSIKREGELKKEGMIAKEINTSNIIEPKRYLSFDMLLNKKGENGIFDITGFTIEEFNELKP